MEWMVRMKGHWWTDHQNLQNTNGMVVQTERTLIIDQPNLQNTDRLIDPGKKTLTDPSNLKNTERYWLLISQT